MSFKTYLGEPFEVVTVWRDGVECRMCGRTIRVREKAGFFEKPASPTVAESLQSARATVVDSQYECRECLYAEPLNEHNTWRTDHEQHIPQPGARPAKPDEHESIRQRRHDLRD